MTYKQLVQGLAPADILRQWPAVTPLAEISGVSTGTNVGDPDVFEGHDQEQIRLMDELCIVLDYNDRPVGSGTKKVCHLMSNIDAGLLHRAFSVFLFNEDGKLLLQQRADEKITFAKMWTNTCCLHPLCVQSEMGADVYALALAVQGAKNAAQRKLLHELGIPSADSPVDQFRFLTRIHYKSASGGADAKWGEHEIDYILILQTRNDITIDANYNEVKDYRWVTQEELRAMFDDESIVFTPWFALICKTLLFKWWDNLGSLEQFADETVHRLLD